VTGRRLSSFLALCALLSISACSSGSSSGPDAQVPPAPPAKASRAFFGVHDASLQSLRGHGIGSLRAWDDGVQWNQIEVAPGQYNWATLDAIVSAAQADHVQVTMVLAMTPAFYAADPTQPPKSPADFGRFVTAVMKRYRDFHGKRGISSYQVWNEANVVNYWTGTQDQMAQLVKTAYDVRQKVDPGAQLIAPPMPTRLSGQVTWLTKFYATKVAGQPVWHYFDVAALNLYPLDTYSGAPGTPEDSINLLNAARTKLVQEGLPASMPVWNTEVNYGLKTGTHAEPHAKAIPVAEQTAYVIRTYLLSAANGVGRVYWYRYDLGALPKSIGGGTLGNTLLSNPTDSTQVAPAGRAIALVERWMTASGAGAPTCTTDSAGTYTCQITYSGGTRRIYWNPKDQEKVTVDQDATSMTDETGQVSDVTGGSSITVDDQPVMVDSPKAAS
jgi:hypothetical protein